jgi:hypothetical protein
MTERTVFMVTLWGVTWGIYSTREKAEAAARRAAEAEESDPEDCCVIQGYNLDHDAA